MKYDLIISILIFILHRMHRENKLLKAYYDFFDARLSDSSLVVGIIGTLIMLVGYVGSNSPYEFAKSNVLENNKIYIAADTNNIVDIGGKKYKLIFEEIKE